MTPTVFKLTVTMPDGTIKTTKMSGRTGAHLCAAFASELGLNVEIEETTSK